MRSKSKQKPIMQHLFTEDEIKYLVRRLTDEFLGGVGPAEPDIPIGAHYQPTTVEGVVASRALREMKVGDSREISNKLRLRPFISAASKLKMQIAYRRLDRGEYRLWKLSEPPVWQKGLKNATEARRKKRAEAKKAAGADAGDNVPKKAAPAPKPVVLESEPKSIDDLLKAAESFQKSRSKK